MSQNVALSTIQSRVCALCGLPSTLDTNTPVTAAVMLDFLKAACALLGGAVKKRVSEFYFTESSTLTTVNGISVVSTPSNFSDLYSLTWQKSTSEEIPLERARTEDFRAYPNAWNDSECTKIFYRIVGNAIEFFPTPDAAYTLNVYYSTGLYPTSTASTFYCRDGWDQWIALQTALMVRGRQQKDATDIRLMLFGPDGQSGLDKDLRDQLRRDKAGIRRVRDVRSSIMGTQRNPWPSNS